MKPADDLVIDGLVNHISKVDSDCCVAK